MNQFGVKFQFIIKPFLIVAGAMLCVYSWLHWWFLIEHDAFVIDEGIVNFAGPMVVAFISVWIWIRPQIRLLNFEGKKIRNPLIGYFLLAWIAIWVPTAFAQEYLISVTGKLTHLTTISQIGYLPKTKYYMLKNMYVDKEQTRQKTVIGTSGKGSVNYDMAIYMPCPIFDSKNVLKSDTIKPLAWLAIKYQKTIRNNSTATEKQQAFDMFVKESQADFDSRDLTTFRFLDRLGLNRESARYADAITFGGVYDTPYIILSPQWERFEDRNGNKLLWLLASFAGGVLIFVSAVASIRLKNDGPDNYSNKFISTPYKVYN